MNWGFKAEKKGKTRQCGNWSVDHVGWGNGAHGHKNSFFGKKFLEKKGWARARYCKSPDTEMLKTVPKSEGWRTSSRLKG